MKPIIYLAIIGVVIYAIYTYNNTVNLQSQINSNQNALTNAGAGLISSLGNILGNNLS